jgi:rare lipoprotein A
MDRGWFAELLYRTIKSANGTRFARATWYADYSASTQTASGERLDNEQFTTAHKTLPFGTRLLVTNLSNGKSVEVRVNDRGPFSTGVDLDLSKSAFAAIASTGAGIITTEYSIVTDTQTTTTQTPAPTDGTTTDTSTSTTGTTTTTDTTQTTTTVDQLPPPIDEHAF